MEWLNYHHLLYFWVAAREGGVARAARALRISQPTVSAQIRRLEQRLGQRLFERKGRGLALTEAGETARTYAEEIFSLGGELLGALAGRPAGKAPRLVVGVENAVPKLVARRLLQPALRLSPRPRLVCVEDRHERLVGALAQHTLDVVISDAPLGPGSRVKAFHHVLGESGIGFFASERIAADLRRGFPASLDGAPLLLPSAGSSLRRDIDRWFDARKIRPRVAGEFDDPALLKVFGQDGLGAFPAATLIERDVVREFDVKPIGRTEEVRQCFHLLTPERRVRHPAVAAILDAGRLEPVPR